MGCPLAGNVVRKRTTYRYCAAGAETGPPKTNPPGYTLSDG